MDPVRAATALVLPALLLACEPAPAPIVQAEPAHTSVPAAQGARRAAPPGAAAKPGAAPGATIPRRNPAPPPGRPAAKADIKWDGPIRWRPWDQGIAEAKTQGKPVCLVIYADWCPKCRSLAPVFKEPELAKLASDFVMIRQDSDERPAWLLERFGALGGYVPRIIFLDKSGKVLEDVTSGNPRYPFFYTPHVADTLKANMRRVAKG